MTPKEQLLHAVNHITSEEEMTEVVRKYILHGLPIVFEHRENDYFEFRNTIAKNFNIGFHEVFIVGSAKLGYSYHKDSVFSMESDIDVVIVCENLFDEFYEQICEFQYTVDKGRFVLNQYEKDRYNQFLYYMAKGWIRPDKIPERFKLKQIKNEWFSFFKSISYGKSSVGDYKVSGGLFKNYKFLERYYTSSLMSIKKL